MYKTLLWLSEIVKGVVYEVKRKLVRVFGMNRQKRSHEQLRDQIILQLFWFCL
jgi:hypothetical protein